MSELKLTVFYWWDLKQYVRGSIEEVLEDFHAALDIADLRKGRRIAPWRYTLGMWLILLVWVLPYVALALLGVVLATILGAYRSVIPYLLHQLRRGLFRLALLGCPSET